MRSQVDEAYHAVNAARSKVISAMNEAASTGLHLDVARHLTCASQFLFALQFVMADAAAAAQASDELVAARARSVPTCGHGK